MANDNRGCTDETLIFPRRRFAFSFVATAKSFRSACCGSGFRSGGGESEFMNETELNERIAQLERENRELRSRLKPERQKVYVLVYRSGALKDQIRAMAHPSDTEAAQAALDLKLKHSDYVIIHTSL